MQQLCERFLRYVSIDTQSSPLGNAVPSTAGQRQLAQELQNALIGLGLDQVRIDEHGILYATLPSSVDRDVPAIGFIAHMDTSPDASGKNVRPQIIHNYDGGNILLGTGPEQLSPEQFPVLNTLHGKTLLTTDGNTLLGADDKAGLAEIVTAIEQLIHQNIPHGEIHIAFTPDEETGKGAGFFDLEAFGAAWAYTVDGGGVGELEAENFNAASAIITITGNNVHPGSAKNVMINALTLAAQLHLALPQDETPEHTEDYQGFFHLVSLGGSVERAEMHYLIRDFDRANFASRKQAIRDIARKIQQDAPAGACIEVAVEDSYYNMQEQIARHPHIIDLARQAMLDCGVEPILCPIRGGTDGAQLTARGLPCPNLFTGGYNFHGKHEFITLEGMQQAVSVIMRIAELTAREAQ